MVKSISLEKLNSILVNQKLDKVINDFMSNNPELITSTEHINAKPRLSKLCLRVAGFKKSINTPFYAFVKNAGQLIAIFDIETGSAKMVDPTIISSETDVKDKDIFKISGVNYGLKDTINGFKRYRPLTFEGKKPRQKMSVFSPEVVDAIEAED